MSTENKKSVAIYFILWLITVAITCTVAFLLYAEDVRNAKFYLSVFMLLLAETILFLYPACLTSRNNSARNTLPHYMGTYIIMSLYGFAVFVLVVLAHTSISFNWLLSLHLILFLAFIVLLGSMIIGGMFITSVDSKDKRERASFMFFKNKFALVCSRLAMIDQNKVQSLCQSFDHFRDEKLEYATSESLPGSEDIQMEMNSCLQHIEDKVADLEEIAAAEDKKASVSSPDSKTKIDTKIQKITKNLNSELKKMSLTLERREKIMGQLR